MDVNLHKVFQVIRNQCRLRRQLLAVVAVLVSITIILWLTGSTKDSRGPVVYEGEPIIQKSFKSASTEGKHNVILSANMNSGSRFTGRFLGFGPDTFYFYEPLRRFAPWDYVTSGNQRCSSVDGDCRKATIEEMNVYRPNPMEKITEPIIYNVSSSMTPVNLLVSVISRIFSCDLVSIRNAIQDGIHDTATFVGPSWQVYRECTSKFLGKSRCLRELEDICTKKPVRTVKLLRLTLGAIAPLLEADPRLKIIHLFRDPRAIIHSRKYSRYYPLSDDESSDNLQKNLCNKMMQDYLEGQNLAKNFPNRIIFVFYEDLLANLNTRLSVLMRLLRINYNAEIVKELTEIKSNLAPPEMGIDFVKDRMSNNAMWWRLYIDWELVKRTDTVCEQIYDVLGYRRIPLQDMLQDLNYSTFVLQKEFALERQSNISDDLT
ncbi:carbohydrate sulfotransferase 1-like isoform X2 [Dreissena polymorpha]|uniref:Sulfotransferase domain-containing protein n=1 Tax=Dreissena polymorpha TaxID=45954 RepID=A0A9D4KBL9_DREPO|nr:carbohydrate sulfotransferase 1-like isoform X2 [Dreissena polymorpha]KAH3836631.1 hypothetical protein DPMN_110002 [Dreissena polymorpha]